MPSNILQFCLGATYNVLPSASNLVRWRQTSDSSCPLCHKSIGTIIHSLTCCPIALDQGRITFRHDSVLNRIISKIKVVINSIRTKGKIKLPTLEFVPAGSNKKPSKGKDPSFGLLHFALDWKILFDLGTHTYIFPPFLETTELRPDICLISTKSHRVILIELTCPREESMEDWHREKTLKYSSLCENISAKGWLVNFFAIEVGARGYCAKNVVHCFRQLGFNSKLAHSTTKDVGFISMQSSFCIWQSSDSREWTEPPLVGTHENPMMRPKAENTDINISDKSPLASPNLLPSPRISNTAHLSSSKNSISANSHSPQQISPPSQARRIRETLSSLKNMSSKEKRRKFFSPRCSNHQRKGRQRPCGLVNFGNTCYANALLQALRTIPEFWTKYEEDPSFSSLLPKSLVQTLDRLQHHSDTLEPKDFLQTLSKRIAEVTRSEFNFNTPQDAPDILRYILNDLTGVSLMMRESIETKLQISNICDNCCASSTKEEGRLILSVPVAPTVEEAITVCTADESLLGDNRYFCHVCGSLQNATRETRIVHAPTTLIVQMQRFQNQGNSSFSRNFSKVTVFPDTLKIKAVSDGVIMKHIYKLRATVNHRGSISSGHYWAYVALSNSTWLKCDDDKISVISKRDLNNDSSYLFFYSRS